MGGPGAIDRPKVFLSHAVTDEPIASVLHGELNRIFANGLDLFTSSVPGTVQPGADWLRSIRRHLDAARAVIVLVTPVSINRPWIWFEVGASWSRMEEGEGRILPVCVPEIDKGSLPEPLSRLQALSLGKADETKLPFQTLVDHFGFGNLKGYRHANIKARLPKYGALPVADADLRSGEIYSGPYEGYSDDELREVLDENYVGQAWHHYQDFPSITRNLVTGKLVHFREVDQELRLPPGTARRFLVEVAEDRYPLIAYHRTHNTVRFTRDVD